MTVFTIGHSTRPLDELVSLLKSHGVRALADVRLIPRSRRHPHFEGAALAVSLPAEGVEYRPFPALGGHRKPRPDSPNGAWENEAFRGYADYMDAPAFREALAALRALAGEKPTAIMCAEAVPWRCHRNLISDALTALGDDVRHITGPGAARAHALTKFAQVRGERLLYPPSQAQFKFGS